MAGASFRTNPVHLHDLLRDCMRGALQLPDFQRSWVWDEDRIKGLIASISRAFPIGAVMTLETGGGVDFKPRPIEGAPEAAKMAMPDALLLDGQQRMTSLYHVALRDAVVETTTPKKKRVKRWFYINILKALDPAIDREEAIVGAPEDRTIRENFGREIVLDLSSREAEFRALCYPVSKIFEWDDWQRQYIEYWMKSGDIGEKWEIIRHFKDDIIDNFLRYQVPVITLERSTSKEAVCVVFEKVNTGGKPLDAFELVTAIYAADGYELRKDWYGNGKENVGRHARFAAAARLPGADNGILADVANTDFLHVISLFHTRDLRRQAEAAGKTGRELPQVTGNRQALLSLPLSAYERYQAQAEDGFLKAARFLHLLHIYRVFDLPISPRSSLLRRF